jgi:para-aminobenzoate synthetase component I
MPSATFHIDHPDGFRSHLMGWLGAFDVSVCLDSNNYRNDPWSRFDLMAAAGVGEPFIPDQRTDVFTGLKGFLDRHKGWVFGYVAYEADQPLSVARRLRTEEKADKKENLSVVTKLRTHQSPPAFFFTPLHRFELKGSTLNIHSETDDPHRLFDAVMACPPPAPWQAPGFALQHRMPKQAYLEAVSAIREHIAAGDVYEMNLCQEFYAEEVVLDAASLYHAFNLAGQTPFAAWVRHGGRYLLCQSPERFLAKRGDLLISQPIKGTIGRGGTSEEDGLLRQQLFNDPKERAENVMIVDLVRNDLARSAVTGSVDVPELFGIRSFPTVHQMVSTVTATLHPEVNPVDAIRHAFPMGSMTGAPKLAAMELIARYESGPRGMYSGTVGYFTPERDFDFNVVIRSMVYNATARYLSFHTGGAITWHSDPEREYAECLLKGRLMQRLLT